MGTMQEPDATQASGSTDSPAPPEPTVVAVVLARSPEAVAAARSHLTEAGLDAGPASGPTFAIVGSASTFREIFGLLPIRAPDGGWTTEQGDELPLDRLPARTQQQLVAIALERPAELHHTVRLDDEAEGSDR